MNDHLILSCDWGTSRFRLRLVDSDTYKVLSETNSGDGIAALNISCPHGHTDGVARQNYFLSYLDQQVNLMQVSAEMDLKGVPVVISGMASSSIGIRELPYSPLPFAMDNKDLITAWLDPFVSCDHPVLLISGVCSSNDVMRGEETQLLGLEYLLRHTAPADRTYILPGTHSKHIFITDGKMRAFKTYMTGEVFSILCKHSILKGSISEPSGKIVSTAHDIAFREGVLASNEANILHTLFMTRTNNLFERFTKEQNYFFLSGLLIGEELRGLIHIQNEIILSAEAPLLSLYDKALEVLEWKHKLPIIPEMGEAAAIVAQIQIYKTHKR